MGIKMDMVVRGYLVKIIIMYNFGASHILGVVFCLETPHLFRKNPGGAFTAMLSGRDYIRRRQRYNINICRQFRKYLKGFGLWID